MSKVNAIQYMIAFIITMFAMTSYLMFLAHHDSQMMNYYDPTIQSRVRE